MDYMAPLPTTELSVQGLFSGLRVGFLGSKVLGLNRQTDVEASPLLLRVINHNRIIASHHESLCIVKYESSIISHQSFIQS